MLVEGTGAGTTALLAGRTGPELQAPLITRFCSMLLGVYREAETPHRQRERDWDLLLLQERVRGT